MAIFCTSCGSSVGENQKFCSKCGSPVGTASAATTTPAPAAPSALGPAPAPISSAPTVAAAPARKSGSAFKIIVAIVAFLAFVSVMAIGSCFYIGYKIKQKARSIMDEPRASATSTPEMHLSDGGPGSAAAAAATVDVPPYPNSTPTSTGGQLSAGMIGGASAQEYATDDSVEIVEQFYKDKFGSKLDFMQSQGKVVFNYLTPNGMTTVTILHDETSGKTKINIARIGK